VGISLIFKNIAVKSMGEAMFNLLSLYYVFDRHYPAVYGVLLLLEYYCLLNKESPIRGKKATRPTGESLLITLKVFWFPFYSRLCDDF
jgi:hypothetical protein